LSRKKAITSGMDREKKIFSVYIMFPPPFSRLETERTKR
jgi:hypothetical protein